MCWSKVNLIKLLVTLVIIVIFESTVLNFSLRPNIMIAAVVFFTLFCGFRTGMLTAAMGGFLVDTYSIGIFGVSAMSNMCVVIGLYSIAQRLDRNNIYIQITTVSFAVIAADSCYYIITKALSPEIEFFSAFIRIIMPTAVITAIIAPPSFEILNRFFKLKKNYFMNYDEN